MRYFLRFILAWTRLDLQIARSAPIQNKANIRQLRADEMKWKAALEKLEINHAA